MELDFIADVILVIMVCTWTFLIVILQISNFMLKSKIPLSMFNKILNLFIHILLLSAMWLNIFNPGTAVSWVLIIFSALFLIVWYLISKYQNKYMINEIEKIEKKIKEIEENENRRLKTNRR